MRTVYGKHIIANLYDIDYKEKDELVNAVKEAVKLANSTLLDIKVYEVEGEMGGISVIAIVLESHIAVHTWRKQRYATIDVYTCGEHTEPEKAFNHLVRFLDPKKVENIAVLDRSQRW